MQTTDIVLSATLIALGYNLISIDRNGERLGRFGFSDVPDEILHEFDLGTLRVEPRTFNNAIKRLTVAARRAPST
jgi:hypothetical protein